MERWLPVVGYEAHYEVSDLGRVRSLDRVLVYERRDQYSGRILTIRRKRKGQMLRPGRMGSGHLSVALGKGNSQLVHVLVLNAFVGPCPAGHECLHGNGRPAENHLGNLRWGTRSENLIDAVRHGTRPVGGRHHRAVLTRADVEEIRSAPATRGRFAAMARRLGVSESAVRGVYHFRSWKTSEVSR